MKFYSYLYNVSSCEGTFKNKVLIFNRKTFFLFYESPRKLYILKEIGMKLRKTTCFTTSKLGNVFLFVEEMFYKQRKKIVLVEKYLRNTEILQCRRFLSQLSHKGIPRILEWVAYPFSSRSSQPRNGTGGLLNCRWILYQLSYQGSPYNIYNILICISCVCVCVCVFSHCSHV